LNLKCDILVSNFAFKWVNSYRYSSEKHWRRGRGGGDAEEGAPKQRGDDDDAPHKNSCTRTHPRR
jgi:hypothetical protein